jgi:cation transport ATPase
VGMLLLQVTTPLTLKALHRLLPERPGLAFGIPSTALLLGAAPGLADVWVLPMWPALLAATLLSAVVVVAGLRLLGSR